MTLFESLRAAPHLLIAGATGSGKSVLINGIICDALTRPDPRSALVLIDPKKVELWQYRPAAWRYTDDPADAEKVLKDMTAIMMRRFELMRQKGLKQWTAGNIEIYIDEFAALVDMNKNVNHPLAQIAILGRAAGLRLILATQRPTRDVLNGCIAVNIDSRIALKTATAQDSRNIIGKAGAELLTVGNGIYRHGAIIEPIEIPLTTDADAAAALEYSKSVYR